MVNVSDEFLVFYIFRLRTVNESTRKIHSKIGLEHSWIFFSSKRSGNHAMFTRGYVSISTWRTSPKLSCMLTVAVA